jgi:peptidoglycan/xylan/chitin deacetylase (PgdA/CDA1 family)
MGTARRSFLASLGGIGTLLAGAKSFSLAQEAARPASGTPQGLARKLSVGMSGFMTPGPRGGMTERADYIKIKVPYKERKGVTFPDGARMAVLFEFATEYFEGGRLGGVTETGVPYQTPRGPNWSQIARTSWFNWECGIQRALDVYDRYGIKATSIFSALGAVYYPQVAKEIAQRGHEIATHGWDESVSSAVLSREIERQSVRREIDVLTEATGVRPVGMLNQAGSPSADSLEFIADENFLWHGDLRDDTLPYGIRYKDKVLVRIPHCNYTHNDPALFGRGPTEYHLSPQKAAEYLKETIDAQLEWAEHEPSVMEIGIHPFFGCYPDRMLTFDRTFAYLRSLPKSKVWLATYKELAEYWKKNYI